MSANGANITQMNYEDLAKRYPDYDKDPLEDIYKKLQQKPVYQGHEHGIFHPAHHQTLKMRNNGMMDIFVHQDNGFRLDPHTQTVNLLTNGFQKHINYMTGWITGNSTYYIGGDWFEKTKGKHRKEIGKNLEFKVGKNLYITVDENEKIRIAGNSEIEIKGNSDVKIEGNLSAKVSGNAKINVSGSTSIHSDGKLSITSGTHINLKAPRIDWN